MLRHLSSILFLFFILCGTAGYGQQAILKGYVYGENMEPLRGANVSLLSFPYSRVTDSLGFFRMLVPTGDSIRIRVSYVGYLPEVQRLKLAPGEERSLILELQPQSQLLREVEIKEYRQEVYREQSSVTRIKPKQIQYLPSPFGDISAALSTLPGVRQNNELSSSYSVRGGSFDENLVYVNEIPIYRPFLIRQGQQEGLSFVNPAMVSSLSFSSGGWQAKWGDKLSSVLNITYKQPDSTAASVSAGLLGGAAHVEGATANGRFTYLAGARHKSARYLLNTLDTQGEYLPSFSDFQSFLTYHLSKRTEVSFLMSYAQNRYLVEPESRETNFGTMQQSFRLNVGFQGQELLTYNMWQNAFKLSHHWNDRFRSSFIASYLHTTEREYVEVEGGYQLCSVDKDQSSSSFDECLTVLGIGTDYQNIRNRLQARILNLQSRNEWKFAQNQLLEFGLQWGNEQIRDRLREWEFTDSADFVQIKDQRLIHNDIALDNQRLEGYVQNTTSLGYGQHTLHYGLRFHYFSLNRQLLFSPRIQYAWRPVWKSNVVFTGALGLYHQPPLYREYRSFSGEIRPDVRSQQSMHVIVGSDLNFNMWGRAFNFVSELYYKPLWDVNPYQVENVRLRYFAHNEAVAYATGADFRLSGEFVPGAESWFSLGLLKTAEDIFGDGRGYIRRPSDQRLNLAVFFQDHLPNDPTYRVYLKLHYGSGLPFGPPGDLENRNIFTARSYKRVDIGFSKILSPRALRLRNLWLGLEILNLLGNANVISYSWISDFNNIQYAVPNTLSNRFFNLKVVANW